MPSTSSARGLSLEHILRYIDEHLAESLSLERLASMADLSVWRFSTVFRRHTGLSPRRYICRQRVQHAQALLRTGLSLARAACDAGFYDQSHLSRHFKNVCGLTPGEYVARWRTQRTAAS